MLWKTKITVDSHISFHENTKVKFGNNEFLIIPENLNASYNPNHIYGCRTYLGSAHTSKQENRYIFHVKNIKGNFEIQSAIFHKYSFQPVHYDSLLQKISEIRTNHSSSSDVTFTILADVNYIEIESKEKHVSVPYRLWISAKRMQTLKQYEYIKDIIALPGYEWLKFKCYIKKIGDKNVEIFIENLFKVKICFSSLAGLNSMNHILALSSAVPGKSSASSDKTADFKFEIYDVENFDETIFFTFAPHELQPLVTTPKVPFPPSPAPLPSLTKPKIENNVLRMKYTDANLISSEGKNFPCHRCVLSKHSPFFDQAFEQCDQIPAKINITNFDGKTVSAFLDFCYGEQTSVAENCNDLIKFADKFNVQELKDICLYYCNEKVDPSNVCEVVQIAYSNNLEELKQKCKQIMIEKKAEIDQTKLKALPKDILFDVFCSF